MFPFTLKQLEIFITVANLSSVSEAARMLHLSQPAISQQIRKIELYSGKELFEQLGRKIYLTEQGKLLLTTAKKVIEQAEVFQLSYTAENTVLTGKLSLSVYIPLQAIFFKVLSKFVKQYPATGLEIIEGNRDMQLRYLHENKVDFCLMVRPATDIQLISERFVDIPMTFIMSPQHQLAKKTKIKLHELQNETFIICEKDSPNYFTLKKLFKKMNMNSPRLIQIKDQNAVKHAVMANLGISVLPKYMLDLEFKQKLITPFKIDNLKNSIVGAYWVQHADKKLSRVSQLFKSFLFNELGEKNIK